MTPALAQKLTGGAEWTQAGGVVFSVSANALATPKGDIKGHIQYTREEQTAVADLIVHASVECFGIDGDGSDGSVAAVAGPAVAQYDPNGSVSGWLVFFVKEGGTGAGDSVRVIFTSESLARGFCSVPSSNTSFPGIVYEGNFTIHP